MNFNLQDQGLGNGIGTFCLFCNIFLKLSI